MLRNVGLRAAGAIWRPPTGNAISAIKRSFVDGRISIGRSLLPQNGTGYTRSFSVHSRSRSISAPVSLQVLRWSTANSTSEPTSIRHLASSTWRRHAHTKSKRRRIASHRREKSSVSDGASKKASVSAPRADLSPTPKSPPSPNPKPSAAAKETAAAKTILDRLPHLPSLHRPTYEELLAAATGAWSRFKIHFKWFSIRSFRPWNIDDISAFFTWIIAGHLIWILVGTTTFFSLIIFMINSVFAQETLAKWIGNYLTKSSGVHVVFESAVVPKWKSGVISFSNVFVSRRPGSTSKVTKGSPAEAAAVAAAAEGKPHVEDDGNYTQFDVSMDTVNVTLSFAKWFNGKGLLRDVEIKGIRGVIDRTNVVSSVWAGIDPRTWKHTHQLGDFELDSFKMEDMLVTVHQPEGFRPFSVSIHLCELPRLRKQWLFYDFMSANVISGAYDNAMFAIHPRQERNFTGRRADDEEVMQWKKHARFRIDSLAIDHLNRGVEGMFAWIKEGKVDIVADMMFPSDDSSIAEIMSDFYDRVEATVTSSPTKEVASAIDHEQASITHQSTKEEQIRQEEDNRFMILDLRVQLADVRATVPIFTKDISYINNALIRPIVAYINSRKAFIPVNCRVVKRLGDFDGSWTVYDSGLMEDLSKEVYEAFARDVLDDDQLRRRRFKKVGVWTLQLAAQALFIGLAGNIA